MPVNSETSPKNANNRKQSTLRGLVDAAIEKRAERADYYAHPIDGGALDAIAATMPTSQDSLSDIPNLTFRQRMIYGEAIIKTVVRYRKSRGYYPTGDEPKPRQWGESLYEHIERACEQHAASVGQYPNSWLTACATAAMPTTHDELSKLPEVSSSDISLYGPVIIEAVAEYKRKQEARAGDGDRAPRQWGESLYEHIERAVHEHAVSIGHQEHPLSRKELAMLTIMYPTSPFHLFNPTGTVNLKHHPEYAAAVIMGVMEYTARNREIATEFMISIAESIPDEGFSRKPSSKPESNLTEEEAPASGMRM